MNKRQVILLWIIAIILGLSVAAVKLTQKDGTKSTTQRTSGQTFLEKFPATDVVSVALQGAEGIVTLVRKEGKWLVSERDNYPANAASVNEFLRALGELKVTRGMEAGPSFAPRFGMDENATKPEDRGLTAIFKDAAGNEVTKVSLGKSIESNADASPLGGGGAVGRYVRNHADESGFYAVSEMFPSVSDEPSRWLAQGFLNPEKIQSISLLALNSDQAEWKITRDDETAQFKAVDAATDEVFDNNANSGLAQLFSYASFIDVIPSGEVASRAEADKKREARIETFEGFKYSLTITPAKPKASGSGEASASDDHLLTVTVSAELPKERKKEEGEKAEDAKTKDEAFTQRLKTLTEKLEKEKALEGRTFLVSKSTVDPLLRERSKIITKVQAPAAAANPSPDTATSPVMEAVTPPIAVPPSE
jgi:hypothetical protein